MTNCRTLYQPDSSISHPTEYQAGPYINEKFIFYEDAPTANIPIHSHPIGTESNSFQHSERLDFHSQPGNPTIPNYRYPSIHQPTDDNESMKPSMRHTRSRGYSSYQERFSLQPLGNNPRRVVSNHGEHHQQGQDLQPNLSLPQESKLSVNHLHIHQNLSQYHSYNGNTTGEENHSIHQCSSNVGVSQPDVTQGQMGKVVLPHHSAVLGEVREDLPVGAQRQGSHVSTTHQVSSMGHDTSSTNRVEDYSLTTQLNQKLHAENPDNLSIPPMMRLMPNHQISLFRDQGGRGPGQTHPWNQQQGSQDHQSHAPFHHQGTLNQNRLHTEARSSNRGSVQHQDGDRCIGKKVFILHFGETAETIDNNPILKLGVTLRRMEVDVTLDMFEYDTQVNSWPLWYEQKIKDSDVVLCIITENFYYQLTNNHVLGNSVYNLMNGSSTKSIAFRAVFLDTVKQMEHIPPAMRGATSYTISSNRLTPNDEEFANLYAFLTGQNRVEKPPLGNMIVLAPKKSRCKSHNFNIIILYVIILFLIVAHFSGGVAPTNNHRNQQPQQQQWQYQQQPQQWQHHQGMTHQPLPPHQSPAPPVNSPSGIPNVEQANLIFTLLGGDDTPVKSIRSHNKMFMQLASKLMAEWEGLGRLLNLSEPDMYAIKADNIHSVTEQAVQMFRQWLMRNGSKATLGVLTTAVYDSGPQYWNLLDTVNKYAPQQ